MANLISPEVATSNQSTSLLNLPVELIREMGRNMDTPAQLLQFACVSSKIYYAIGYFDMYTKDAIHWRELHYQEIPEETSDYEFCPRPRAKKPTPSIVWLIFNAKDIELIRKCIAAYWINFPESLRGEELPEDEYFWARDRVAAGVPDIHELRWVNWMPNGAHIAFSPVSPIRGANAIKLYELAKQRHKEFGIDLFPAFYVGLRKIHLIVKLIYNRADPKKR